MISIIDYGLSNLSCVLSAVQRLGFEATIAKDGSEIASASMIILPGVGAFGDAMGNLRERNFVGPLNEAVQERKVPFLGICLGAQLICTSSDEFGNHDGLGWIDADVREIEATDQNLRVPHTGWDEIEIVHDSSVMQDIQADSLFYYNHSHAIYPNSQSNVVAYCDYGERFASILQKDNIFATQFHPEKSQKTGLELLKNILKLSSDAA